MTKKKLRVGFLTLISCVFIFSSCDNVGDEIVDNPDSKLPEIYLLDERIVFSSREVLIEKYKELVEAGEEGIASFNSEMENISLFEFEKELVENSETDIAFQNLQLTYPEVFVERDSSLESVVEDPILASFFNKDRILQFGDTIVYVSHDQVKYVTDGDGSKIELLRQGFGSLPSEGIIAFPVTREVSDISQTSGLCSQTCISGLSYKRLKGQIRRLNLGFFNAIWAKSSYQKKGRRWWRGAKSNTISVEAGFKGNPDSYKRKERTNKKSVTVWLAFGGGVSAPSLPGLQMEGFHWANAGSCTTCK